MKRLIVLMSALSILLLGGVVYANRSEEVVVPIKPIVPTNVSELHRLVNQERVSRGIAPLTLDDRLNSTAQLKADDMTKDGYYDHIDPNTGLKYGVYMDQIFGDNRVCKSTSENLNNRVNEYTSSETTNSWMDSQSHRDAILNSKYDLVGYAISGEFVVQHFCDL